MGRNITFEKRRHSYKAALAVKIRMRAIVTNFVVYNLLHASCMQRNLFIETHAPRGGGFESFEKLHAARARRARTILFFLADASCMRTRGVHARIFYKFMKPSEHRIPRATTFSEA
jgi:hypothetical protein